MEQTSETKDGLTTNNGEVAFDIGGHEFILRPMNLKSLRALTACINGTIGDFQKLNTESALESVVDIFFIRMHEISRLIFPKDAEILTREFSEEYVTIPLTRQIFDQILKVNRLDDLLPKIMSFMKAGGASFSTKKTGQ